MSFIYPLFLLAGLALAIPVVIHLFNLRRYKTVYFPHTRFLKNIQLRSQRSSQLRYKWLLALRLLFLAVLILAFAQPFLADNTATDTTNRLQAIYLDNSGSMSVKDDSRRVFDIAKESVSTQVKKAPEGTKFILLTNDKPVSYTPMPAERVLSELNRVEISPVSKTSEQVLSDLNSISRSESYRSADLYYYSDFQENSIQKSPAKELSDNVHVYAVPFQKDKTSNIYIDTAYLTNPVLQTVAPNILVVKTRLYGEKPDEDPVLTLNVNGQVKSAATLYYSDEGERTDTLTFRVNDAAWQKVELAINDESVKFDDTFRITARSAANLSVLCLNEKTPSPYIQAAFRAGNGFRLDNVDINNPPENWQGYNLIILNGCTVISNQLGMRLNEAIQSGKSVCIFPTVTPNFSGLQSGLQQLADIRITGVDTTTQTSTNFQEGSDIARELFDAVPDNIQLPTANAHYIIDAGITANQQSVISFRNGDPLFAKYSQGMGNLYLLTAGIEPQSGNFQSGYFFAPFLYTMAMQSSGGNVYAITAGSGQPAFLALADADERNMIHLLNNGKDIIPAQRTQGTGLNVFTDDAVISPGFYPLYAKGRDTTFIALNQSRAESWLATTSNSDLKDKWNTAEVTVLSSKQFDGVADAGSMAGFPLWKVCVILALILLAAETWLLTGGFRKPIAATQ